MRRLCGSVLLACTHAATALLSFACAAAEVPSSSQTGLFASSQCQLCDALELHEALPQACASRVDARPARPARRQELPAVKAGRVVLVDGNQMFNRPVSATFLAFQGFCSFPGACASSLSAVAF